MRKKIQILILSLISTLTFGQTKNESFWSPYIESDRIAIDLKHYDSLNFEKAYRIWTEYQVVELIKYSDSTYSGILTNFVTHIINKKKKEIIFQKIRIPDKTVEKLIKKLNSENIENLKDCSKVENYTQGLDGKTYIFEIGIDDKRRVYSYWEPESDYQNPKIPEVKHVRNILKAINSEFDLWDYFTKFRDNLPKGDYSYGMRHMSKI